MKAAASPLLYLIRSVFVADNCAGSLASSVSAFLSQQVRTRLGQMTSPLCCTQPTCLSRLSHPTAFCVLMLRPTYLFSVKVEQTLRDVQTSRSRLRFLLLWLEQVTPAVTDSNAPDGAEDDERHPPCLTLANSILTILREPLPSDKPSSALPRSRVSVAQPAML